MSYQIKQAPLGARLGTGIGQGLSEQIPKEIERGRLASGLKQFEQDASGLNPMQQLARLSSIPGITPQMIQSFGELARQQSQRQSYINRANSNQNMPKQASQPLSNVDFVNLNQRRQAGPQEQTPQGNFSSGEPQILEKNPLSPELQPVIPWSPAQRDDEIGRVWDLNPWMTRDEVLRQVEDNERRYLESPKAYQEQQKYLEDQQAKANSEIDSQLRKKLQIPKDKEIFEGNKITGETVNRIERGVSRDLRKNPNSNLNDLVNVWTDRALNNDKQKSELSKLANRSLDEKLLKKSDNLEKLKSISKSFKEFGNSEEYYNNLRSSFDLSPEGAASIAYPLSKSADNYLQKIKPSQVNKFNVPVNANENSIKHAYNLGDYLTREDSVLSIAKNIKEKDPFFDIKTFLSEVRSIQDELGLTPQQKLEINSRGIDDIFPNWGDIFLFPKMGKGL